MIYSQDCFSGNRHIVAVDVMALIFIGHFTFMVFGRPFIKQFALRYRTVVLSICPVCDVGVLWPNGWMDQDKFGMQIGLGPGHIV